MNSNKIKEHVKEQNKRKRTKNVQQEQKRIKDKKVIPQKELGQRTHIKINTK